MKVFKKTHLPDSITYNGEEYKLAPTISGAMRKSNTNPQKVINAVKSTGEKAVLVKVLSNKLKGKTDLHGKPYKPSEFIFITSTNK